MYSWRFESRTSGVRVTIRRNCLKSLNMWYTLYISGSSPIQNPLSWWTSDPVQSNPHGLDWIMNPADWSSPFHTLTGRHRPQARPGKGGRTAPSEKTDTTAAATRTASYGKERSSKPRRRDGAGSSPATSGRPESRHRPPATAAPPEADIRRTHRRPIRRDPHRARLRRLPPPVPVPR